MNKKSALRAAAIAGLVVAATACTSSPKSSVEAAKGECHGINSCKGTGECGGPGWSCAGKNTCKGQGWITLTQNECEAKGGKFKAN